MFEDDFRPVSDVRRKRRTLPQRDIRSSLDHWK